MHMKSWDEIAWEQLERHASRRALQCRKDEDLWNVLITEARHVLRSFSTSFFLVTRFLPASKQGMVEVIYAAVRYPDEIVDSFPLNAAERLQRLDCWQAGYDRALQISSVRDSIAAGIPLFLAGFVHIVKNHGIPHEHYRSFIKSMRIDALPCSFQTLGDLINDYVYGSAIVVGYFLTYIYGYSSPANRERAFQASRDLGIALQLTNFLRDVRDDQQRGRVYLPLNWLAAEGIVKLDVNDRSQHPALHRVLRQLGTVANQYYGRSLAALDAFSPDCQTAINACIKFYCRLNEHMCSNADIILNRAKLPASEKFKMLPISKYWRLPLAYLTR